MSDEVIDPLERLKKLFFDIAEVILEFLQRFIILIAAGFFIILALLLIFFNLL